MKFSFRRIWPWLVLLAIPLWLAAVAGELLDARLLEKEGVAVTGRLESPEWVTGRGGARRLSFEAVWSHEGRELRRGFIVPAVVGEKFVDRDGRLIEPRLEMRYAPSQPEVAELVEMPPDPVWVIVLIACVGFSVLCGVIVFLIMDRRKSKRCKS